MRQLRVSEAAVRCLAYSPDGRWLATGDEAGFVRLWSLPGCEPAEAIDELGGDSVEALAFHPSGKCFAAGLGEGEVCLLDMSSRKVFPRMKTHERAVRALAWSSDGTLLASTGWDRTIRHWSATLHEVSVRPTPEIVLGLAVVPGKRTLAMVGDAGSLEVVDFPGVTRGVNVAFPLFTVAVAPSGKLLATGGVRGELALWDISDLQKKVRLLGHEGNVYGLAFAPNGETLVSGAADGAVCVWDMPARRLVETYRWHSRWVTCVGVSPDGMTAAAGSADGTVVVWDLDR